MPDARDRFAAALLAAWAAVRASLPSSYICIGKLLDTIQASFRDGALDGA